MSSAVRAGWSRGGGLAARGAVRPAAREQHPPAPGPRRSLARTGCGLGVRANRWPSAHERQQQSDGLRPDGTPGGSRFRSRRPARRRRRVVAPEAPHTTGRSPLEGLAATLPTRPPIRTSAPTTPSSPRSRTGSFPPRPSGSSTTSLSESDRPGRRWRRLRRSTARRQPRTGRRAMWQRRESEPWQPVSQGRSCADRSAYPLWLTDASRRAPRCGESASRALPITFKRLCVAPGHAPLGHSRSSSPCWPSRPAALPHSSRLPPPAARPCR